MNLRFGKLVLVVAVLAAFLSVHPAWGQAASSQPVFQQSQPNAANEVGNQAGFMKPGVVVEEVNVGFGAARAGIQKGDILLSWSRGDAQGAIESPFDLAEIEIQQGPKGPVSLQGLRGPEKLNWVMGPDIWGIKSLPAFTRPALEVYRQGQEFAIAGQWRQAAESWRSLAGHTQRSSPQWLPSWLFFHAAAMQAEARHWKDADEGYQLALQSEGATPPDIRAQVLRDCGTAFEQRSNWAMAEKYYQQAAELDGSNPENLALALDLNNLGKVAFQKGDLPKAQEYHRRSLEIRVKSAPGSIVVALSLNNLGEVLDYMGDLAKAESYEQQALSMSENLAPGSLAVAAIVRNLGDVAYDRGELDKAENYYGQSLEIREKQVPASLDVARSLNNMGLVAWQRGELNKAEEYHFKALAIREKLAPDSLSVASSLNNLALIRWHRGDLAKEEELVRRAIAIKQRLAPDGMDAATSLSNLGVLAWQRGDLVKAEELTRHALSIRQRLAPLSTAVAMSLDNLGLVTLERGALADAERYAREGLAIRQKLAPGSLDVAMSFNILGLIARQRGNLAQAAAYYQQGLSIREKLAPGSVEMARNLTRLGDVAQDRGDLLSAEAYYRRANEIWSNLAPGSVNEAETLSALASILRKGNQLDAAAQVFQQSLIALEKGTDLLGGTQQVTADFRGRHEGFYKQYGDLLIAQQRPDLAFQVLERSRARTLLETLATAQVSIRKGADAALFDRERNLHAEIHAKSERRIRLLGGKQSTGQVKEVEKEISSLLSQLQDVESEIRAANPGYAALTQPQPLSAKEVQQQLLDSDTVLLEYSLGQDRSYVFAVTSTSLTAVELPKRSVIESAARRVYDLLTVRNHSVKGETAEQQVNRLNLAEAAYPRAAAELSRMVLGPVASQLTAKTAGQKKGRGKSQRLLIVADGALQYIPFAMLPEPPAQTSHTPLPSARENRLQLNAQTQIPLVVNHEVVNLPSASVLAVLRQQENGRTPAPKAVAVIADPVFDARDSRLATAIRSRAPGKAVVVNLSPTLGSAPVDSLDALPESTSANLLTRSATDLGLSRDGHLTLPRLLYSRQEAEAIRAVTPAGDIKEAVDFEATRDAAISPELRNYRIVHFATHGLLNSEHPELSGLVFSLVDKNGQPQDGFLQLQDIYNLDLPADLVVLSACETGLGKEINGEGLIGLTRGFMYAGATRVVASLWNVSDAATAQLMAEFYRAMEKEHMPPAAALRAAQVHMWKQKRWSSPYYWAAFQIQGEWK